MPEPDPLPAIKTPWGAATPPCGASAADVPRIPIPDHTLIRRIGKGSYGEVWLARNVLGVYRAVKIIHRGSFDDDRPFEREFAGMQRFEPVSRSHESQLNILQVGRGPDCFYYVMELADDMGRGAAIDEASYTPRNLRSELLLRGRLPVDECVRLGLALTTALEHLHRHGLVHRDIKPSNIVFVNGIPKLADIGLVALAESTMSFVGTEGYLPPEGPGTVQADLFSLGKVLYELSTGRDRQQFPELPTGITELPDRAALAELNVVLLRACAPDVKQRYESAAEMHADLALLQSGRSVARMRAVERRLKFVARAGAVVTGIALLAGGAFFYQQFQTREARRLAKENQSLADDKLKLADENREQLVRLRIANGVRLMDADDYSGALLWFAEALPLVTNKPLEEAIHRIRIQQVLNHSPRLLHVLAHDAGVSSGAFSPDGRRIAAGTREGDLLVWDVESGERLVGSQSHLGKGIQGLRFTRDGARILARSCSDQLRPETDGIAAVVDAATGHAVFPIVTNAVRTAFSPDDRWLAVARTNLVIEVLEASTGRHLLDLSGHSNEITMLSFSRDGGLLASASMDQTVRLWRLPSGEPVGSPIRHDQAVARAVFSPNARRLATATEAPLGGKSCSIHTWDVASGTEVGSAIPAANFVFALTFDEATGRRLLTGDDNIWVNVWDAETHGALLAPLRMERSTARCWAFSPDGLRFAAGSSDGTACVWNLTTGEALTPRLRHVGWVESVQFSPDGARLLTTSDDGTAKVWDLATLPEVAKPLQLDGRIASADPTLFPNALSPDGYRLFVALNPQPPTFQSVDLGTLSVKDVPLAAPDEDLPGLIRFDAGGRQWAVALGALKGVGRSRSVGLWQQEDRAVRHFDLAHAQAVRALLFSNDSEQLTTLADDGVLRTWRTTNGTLAAKVQLPEQYASADDFSPDGKKVVFRRKDGLLEVFDREKPTATGALLAGSVSINMIRFSPDGRRLASVGSDQCGRIWDARTGQPLTLPFKHGGTLFSVEWSPDGRRVVTSGLSGEAKLWDANTGEPVLAPMGLEGTTRVGHIRVSHFSPDGRFVVARSDNFTARVWDAVTTEAITPILAHAGEVRAAMITTNNRLVTLSDPNLVRGWDLKDTSLSVAVISEYARLLAGRRLDRAGVLQPISAKELGELCHALRSKQPALFDASTSQLGEWHRRQVTELITLAEVKVAAFHTAQIAALAPTNSETKELRSKVEARLIPARDPATPENLVDLSDFYTHSFGLLPDQEFADLPCGVQMLSGTPFDVRGMVRLESLDSASTLAPFPQPMVAHIGVGRRCRQLHFLHGVDRSQGKDGEEIARWVIHFADGSIREWPVVYGEHLRDWWGDTDSPKPAGQAEIAWEGHSPITIQRGADCVRLFKATWTNTLPNVVISHLDFVISKASARPFVVGITAE